MQKDKRWEPGEAPYLGSHLIPLVSIPGFEKTMKKPAASAASFLNSFFSLEPKELNPLFNAPGSSIVSGSFSIAHNPDGSMSVSHASEGKNEHLFSIKTNQPGNEFLPANPYRASGFEVIFPSEGAFHRSEELLPGLILYLKPDKQENPAPAGEQARTPEENQALQEMNALFGVFERQLSYFLEICQNDWQYTDGAWARWSERMREYEKEGIVLSYYDKVSLIASTYVIPGPLTSPIFYTESKHLQESLNSGGQGRGQNEPRSSRLNLLYLSSVAANYPYFKPGEIPQNPIELEYLHGAYGMIKLLLKDHKHLMSNEDFELKYNQFNNAGARLVLPDFERNLMPILYDYAKQNGFLDEGSANYGPYVKERLEAMRQLCSNCDKGVSATLGIIGKCKQFANNELISQESAAQNNVSLYPNPINRSSTRLELDSANGGGVQLIFTNYRGERVASKSYDLSEGRNVIDITELVSGLQSGNHVLSISAGTSEPFTPDFSLQVPGGELNWLEENELKQYLDYLGSLFNTSAPVKDQNWVSINLLVP